MMLCRIAPPRIDDEAGMVDIPYIVWPRALIDEPWSAATMEADAPMEAPEIQYESELDTPSAPSAAAVVQYPDNSYETRVRFEAVEGGTVAEAVYRGYTDGEPNAFASMTEYSGPGSTRYGWAATNTTGGRVDFKCRFFNDDDEGSYYSPLLSIDPMVIDNSAPPAPSLSATRENPGSGSRYEIHATASTTAMNAAVLKIQRFEAGAWQDLASGNGRPEQILTADTSETSGTTSKTVQLRAIAYASDGTESPAATFDVFIPGSGL